MTDGLLVLGREWFGAFHSSVRVMIGLAETVKGCPNDQLFYFKNCNSVLKHHLKVDQL
jgi:hypothetical protein